MAMDHNPNAFFVTDEEIEAAQHALLPAGCEFNEEARNIIRCWESKEVVACPGSGKTTVLLAKLKHLATRMPFSDGAGICVLSHTNVAVNEIKSKLTNEADKLLGYPNFVGTLQSFIDKFIVLPFLRSYTTATIRPMDNTAYGTMLMSLVYSNTHYATLKALIKRQYGQSGGQYKDELDYTIGLHLEPDGLYPRVGRKLAGADKQSAIQYQRAVVQLLKEQGAIRFSDAYQYALLAMDRMDAQYRHLLTKRFRYVFVDEYQDCSVLQRDIIDRLFPADQCAIMKIGDVDQSIFNGKNEAQLWEAGDNSLPLSCSNRYGQEIANVLTHLRTGKTSIVSSKGETDLKPVLIVFDINNPSSALPEFLSILNQKGLTDTDGTYKVIGKIKNGKGLKIGDYWHAFNVNNLKSQDNYWVYLNDIQFALSCGELYLAESSIRKLLCEVLRLRKTRDDIGSYYNASTIKAYITLQGCDDIYREKILSFTQLELQGEIIDQNIRSLIGTIISPDAPDTDIFGLLPGYFFAGATTTSAEQKNEHNLYIDDCGRKILFDTVHGVKGETHDATLYVETAEQNGYDLRRIIPLLEGKRPSNTDVAEYARRCVYVGLSRPRTLLCVAMTGDTFTGHEKAFEDWEIMDIRS